MSLMGSAAQVTVLNGGAHKKGNTMGGSAARRLAASGWNVNALRTNTTLLYDEWKLFDNTVIQIARERLIIAGELMSRGLVYPIPNALGVIQLVWQTSGDMNPAALSMTGLDEADKDAMDFGIASMPIPMIHKEFTLDLRQLETSRRGGLPLDTVQAEVATRKVAELVDQIIFTGVTIAQNLGQGYGILTQPNRVTGSVTANWLTATGLQIIADVLAMQAALFAKNMFGPYMLFVPTATYINLSNDFKTNSDKTIIGRILEIPGIQGVMPTNRLTGTNVVMMQMTSDVIQLVEGMQPTMIEWEERGGFELNFMVFAILLPRCRADYNNQCGIAHFS